jgi:hypothetical protein
MDTVLAPDASEVAASVLVQVLGLSAAETCSAVAVLPPDEDEAAHRRCRSPSLVVAGEDRRSAVT